MCVQLGKTSDEDISIARLAAYRKRRGLVDMAAIFERRPSPPRCSFLAKLLPTTAAVAVLLFGKTSTANSSGSGSYPLCTSDESGLGDGRCTPAANTEECGYDGGDCCECTCVDGEDDDYNCGPTYQCFDPTASCYLEEGSNPYPSCEFIEHVGDGFCDLDSNIEDCGYDGGDCCECTCETAESTCGEETDYICQDPDAECFVEGAEFTLTISTCAGDNSASKNTVEFYTCSGGTYCDIDTETDDPKRSARFTSDGESQTFVINADVEPTTLVVSKPTGVDGWCVDEIKWNGGNNLLANSSVVYLDESDGDEDNCQGGIKGDSDDDSGPCMEEWRFFNLQGDADYEYELKVRACPSESPPQVNASFCPDVKCGTTDVQLLQLTDFSAGLTTFPVQLDFNPVAMRFSASDDGWCADAMSFNGFDLAETYPYELDAGVSRIVSNVQAYGEAATPAQTPAPVPAVLAEEDSGDGDGVWFEALWEIVVTVVGGIALACITGAAGVSYKRWRRKQDTRGEQLPGSRSTRVPPCDGDLETEEHPAYERNLAPPSCDGLAQGRTATP
ncbi:unnamed protein product [Ectocarpus sp. 6 AP-2014]